jgi:hypothetical protein
MAMATPMVGIPETLQNPFATPVGPVKGSAA